MKTIVALQPKAQLIGYAVFRGAELIDWGTKNLEPYAISQRVSKIAAPFVLYLVDWHEAETVVLPELFGRQPSVRNGLIKLVRSRTQSETVVTFSREDIHRTFRSFLDTEQMNRDLMIKALVKWFPELEASIPNPRRFWWQPPGYWVPMFDAVALAITFLSSQ